MNGGLKVFQLDHQRSKEDKLHIFQLCEDGESLTDAARIVVPVNATIAAEPDADELVSHVEVTNKAAEALDILICGDSRIHSCCHRTGRGQSTPTLYFRCAVKDKQTVLESVLKRGSKIHCITTIACFANRHQGLKFAQTRKNQKTLEFWSSSKGSA